MTDSVQAGEGTWRKGFPDMQAVLRAATELRLPICGGMTADNGIRITFIPEADLAKVLTQAVADHNKAFWVVEARDWIERLIVAMGLCGEACTDAREFLARYPQQEGN